MRLAFLLIVRCNLACAATPAVGGALALELSDEDLFGVGSSDDGAAAAGATVGDAAGEAVAAVASG